MPTHSQTLPHLDAVRLARRIEIATSQRNAQRKEIWKTRWGRIRITGRKSTFSAGTLMRIDEPHSIEVCASEDLGSDQKPDTETARAITPWLCRFDFVPESPNDVSVHIDYPRSEIARWIFELFAASDPPLSAPSDLVIIPNAQDDLDTWLDWYHVMRRADQKYNGKRVTFKLISELSSFSHDRVRKAHTGCEEDICDRGRMR